MINLPLVDLLNESPYDFYFLVVDKFLDINLPRLKNFYSISADKFGIKLTEKNSGRLLSHPKVIEFIQKNSEKTGNKPAIVPFKPSAKLELLCQKNNFILVANHASLNRTFEDKIKFSELCQEYKLPVIPNIIGALSPDLLTKAIHQFGEKLVIQTHFGWAGNSSYFISSTVEALSQIPINTIVKISPYLNGFTLINNCCFTKTGLIQSPPGLQYTGISPLTKNKLATVGRQWPSNASLAIKKQIHTITNNFTSILKKYNYQGFFGLDFLVHENKVYLLECNPRLTASFAFYTHIELNHHLTPLFYYHLAEFTLANYPLDINKESQRFFNSDLIGSEITRKNSQGTTVSKYNAFKSFASVTDVSTFSQEIISHLS